MEYPKIIINGTPMIADSNREPIELEEKEDSPLIIESPQRNPQNQEASRNFCNILRKLFHITILLSVVCSALYSKDHKTSMSWVFYGTLVVDIMLPVLHIFYFINSFFVKNEFLLNRESIIKTRKSLFCSIFSVWNCFNTILIIFEIASCLDGLFIVLNINYIPPYMAAFIRVSKLAVLIIVVADYSNVGSFQSLEMSDLLPFFLVLIFSGFFSVFFALIGVQILVSVQTFCVSQNASKNSVTSMDFLIPLTHCTYDGTHGYLCPDGFECRNIKELGLEDSLLSFSNFFDGFVYVYYVSTLNGWSSNFYVCMNTFEPWVTVIFFFLMIYFVGWIVKNIFIAVLMEIVDKIISKEDNTEDSKIEEANVDKYVLGTDGVKLELYDLRSKGLSQSQVMSGLRKYLKSSHHAFIVTILIFTDIFVTAFNRDLWQWKLAVSMAFATFFILNFLSFGMFRYFTNSSCWFQLIVTVGSILSVFWSKKQIYYLEIFTSLRIIILLEMIETLNIYVRRILGNLKSFTIALLIVFICVGLTAVAVLQILSGLPSFDRTKPTIQNFRDAFDIIIYLFVQDFDSATTILSSYSVYLRYLIHLLFIGCNMLLAVIITNTFIGYVLSNLELSKKERLDFQKKIHVYFPMNEDSEDYEYHEITVELNSAIKESDLIPTNLKIYSWFQSSPELVQKPKCVAIVKVPKVKKSFLDYFYSNSYVKGSERIYVDDLSLALSFEDRHYLNFLVFNIDKECPRLKSERKYPLGGIETFSDRIKCMKHLKDTISPLYAENPTIQTKMYRKNENDANLFQADEIPIIKSESLIQLEDMKSKVSRAKKHFAKVISEIQNNHPQYDLAFGFMSKKSRFRAVINRILTVKPIPRSSEEEAKKNVPAFSKEALIEYINSNSAFNWVMLIVINMSCISMFFETVPNHVFTNRKTTIIEIIYIFMCTFEFIFKCIQKGLFFTPNAYLVRIQGFSTFFTYLVSLLHLVYFKNVITTGDFSLASLSMTGFVIRVLRTLRPLRLFVDSQSIRYVIKLLLGCWKNILKVTAVVMIATSIYTYYAYFLLKYNMQICNDPGITDLKDCKGLFYASIQPPQISGIPDDRNTQMPKILVPRVVWTPFKANYETLSKSLLSSFIIFTLDDWATTMEFIIERTGPAMRYVIYFYVITSNLVLIAMFVGVVVQSFYENEGIAALTPVQRQWTDLNKLMELTSPLQIPKTPETTWKLMIFKFYQSRLYITIYTIVILVSAAAFMPNAWDDEFYQNRNMILRKINNCAFIIVLVDIGFKLLGYGFFGYFRSSRNLVDFILGLCAGVSVFGFILNIPIKILNKYTFVVTMMHMVVLLSKFEKMYALLQAFILSILRSFPAMATFLIFTQCYVLLGVQLFGRTRFGPYVSTILNFRTSFGLSMLLLKTSTSDGWSSNLEEATVSPPYCSFDASQPMLSDCGNYYVGVLYYVSYLIIVCYIFINLLIALVLANFSFFAKRHTLDFGESHIQTFRKLWRVFDVDQKGKLKSSEIEMVYRVYLTRKTFGVGEYVLIGEMLGELEDKSGSLDNPNQLYSFNDSLNVLAIRSININDCLTASEIIERQQFITQVRQRISTKIIVNWFLSIKPSLSVELNPHRTEESNE